MGYCKKLETDAYVDKYCKIWYCIQIGAIGVFAAIVLFAVAFQNHKGYDLVTFGSLGMHAKMV